MKHPKIEVLTGERVYEYFEFFSEYLPIFDIVEEYFDSLIDLIIPTSDFQPGGRLGEYLKHAEFKNDEEMQMVIGKYFEYYNSVTAFVESSENIGRSKKSINAFIDQLLDIFYSFSSINDGDFEAISSHFIGKSLEIVSIVIEKYGLNLKDNQELFDEKLIRSIGENSAFLFHSILGFIEKIKNGSKKKRGKDSVERLTSVLFVAVFQLISELNVLRKKELSQEIKANIIAFKNKTKLGRNDPCFCGSGKKFKYCCINKVN